MTGSWLANHLWQSTAAAGVAWLVTLALRRDRAGARYGVWLAASLKFLIPFALLITAGGYLGWRPLVVVTSEPYGVMIETVGRPFSETAVRIVAGQPAAAPSAFRALASIAPTALLALSGVWLLGAIALVALWTVRWRWLAAVVRSARPVDRGPVFDILRRLERSAGITRPIALVSSRGSLEPGVFGILRPVLVWPERISEHLSAAQIDAIVAHEVTHVRRRDNLAAAAHMAVQAAFWFHPIVWWMGSRLVDERERACDEDVVRLLGHDRQVYAESILKTCQFYVESPLVCVAGVTGSELKKRIEHIMKSESRLRLSVWKKALLTATAIAAVATPIVFGALVTPRLRAQEPAAAGSKAAFDVTLVKPNRSADPRITMLQSPSTGWTATNVTVGMLVRIAYRLQDNQIDGGPKWIWEDRFDASGKGAAPGRDGPFFEKLQTLLADRFKVVTHVETRQLPMFELVLARRDGKLGPKLKPSSLDCQTAPSPDGRGRVAGPPPGMPPPGMPPPGAGPGRGANVVGRGQMLIDAFPKPGDPPRCGFFGGNGQFFAGGATMVTLADSLARMVGSTVTDKTGLTGQFDFNIEYTPDPNMGGRRDLPPPPPGVVNDRPAADGPSIFTAIIEQLGLKLESTKGPVDVTVIDRAEHPTEN